MIERRNKGSYSNHPPKRMNDEEGLSAVRDILRSGDRTGLGAQHRLSLAEVFVLKRLHNEGPWGLLAEIFEHEQSKARTLESELDIACENFANVPDCGRTAFVRSVKALLDHATPVRPPIHGPTLNRSRLVTITNGLEAFADLEAGVKSPFFDRATPSSNARLPNTELALFHGEVAAFIEVLLLSRAGARGAKTWACAETHKLAKKKAERLNVAFHKTTPESWHERVADFQWKDLLSEQVYELAALKGYETERLRFLTILRSATAASIRGDNLETYCKALATDAFGAALVPARAD